MTTIDHITAVLAIIACPLAVLMYPGMFGGDAYDRDR